MSPVYETKLTRWLPAALVALTMLTAWAASAQTPTVPPQTPGAPPQTPAPYVERSKSKKIPLPDMIISNVTDEINANQKTILFHVTVKNIGNVPGKPYAIVADLPDGPQVVSYLGADLAAKAEVTLDITLDNPANPHTFRFYVDGTYLLKELNENNNRSADIPVDGYLLKQKILQENVVPFKLKNNDNLILKLVPKP
jgi:hypothetical protein